MKRFLLIIIFLWPLCSLADWQTDLANYSIPKKFKLDSSKILKLNSAEKKEEIVESYKAYANGIRNNYKKTLNVDYCPFADKYQEEEVGRMALVEKLEKAEDFKVFEEKVNAMLETSLKFFREYSFNVSLHRVFTLEKENKEILETQEELKKLIQNMSEKLQNKEQQIATMGGEPKADSNEKVFRVIVLLLLFSNIYLLFFPSKV